MPGGANQEQATLRHQAVRLQVRPLALFGQDPLDATLDVGGERHLGQPRFRIRGREQSGQLAAWLDHRHRPRPLPPAIPGCHRPRAVDDIAQLLGEAAMALSRGLGRDLQGDRIETLVVALGVAPDQRLDLCGCRHWMVSRKKVARKRLKAKQLLVRHDSQSSRRSLPEIWRDYVEPEYRELVRQSYWKDEHQTILNGRTPVIGRASCRERV